MKSKGVVLGIIAAGIMVALLFLACLALQKGSVGVGLALAATATVCAGFGFSGLSRLQKHRSMVALTFVGYAVLGVGSYLLFTYVLS